MRRAIAAGTAVLSLVVTGLALAACDKEPTPGGTTTTEAGALPFEGSPSRATLAKAGVPLPAAATGYRSVRVDADELDVAFELPTTEVDSMVEALGLPTLAEGRAIIHASPVWSVDPAGTVRSATGTTDRGLRVAVEVVTPPGGGDTAAVHVVVAAAAS